MIYSRPEGSEVVDLAREEEEIVGDRCHAYMRCHIYLREQVSVKGQTQRRPSIDGVRYMTTTKILERPGMEQAQTSRQPSRRSAGRVGGNRSYA